jgi:hypothetical protein
MLSGCGAGSCGLASEPEALILTVSNASTTVPPSIGPESTWTLNGECPRPRRSRIPTHRNPRRGAPRLRERLFIEPPPLRRPLGCGKAGHAARAMRGGVPSPAREVPMGYACTQVSMSKFGCPATRPRRLVGDFGLLIRPLPSSRSRAPSSRAPTCSPPAHAYAASRRMAWGPLLKRTFAVDVQECAKCHGRLSIIGTVLDPVSARAILLRLAIPTAAPALARARDPTELAGSEDDQESQGA